MIYLKMAGRIGNQLFMYGVARAIQKLSGDNQTIVIEDYNNVAHDNQNHYYENSLVKYPLENVTYVHDKKIWKSRRFFVQRNILRCLTFIEKRITPTKLKDLEVKLQPVFNHFGIYRMLHGYVEYPQKFKKNICVSGYFQSPKYLESVREELVDILLLNKELEKSNYPNLHDIESRNTVCISIKVQHNVGNKLFDVCDKEYYKKAISLIVERVDNPLFFVCSDNTEYVFEHLIDVNKYDCVVQDPSFPVHISLAVMARSKHFIIGNSTYAWWAQYLCCNPNKIVVAPSRWFGIDMPCDIYMDNWELIDV